MKSIYLEILRIIGDGEVSGREIRNVLNKGKWWWSRWSGPAFYSMMWKMEDLKLIKSRKLSDKLGFLWYYSKV